MDVMEFKLCLRFLFISLMISTSGEAKTFNGFFIPQMNQWGNGLWVLWILGLPPLLTMKVKASWYTKNWAMGNQTHIANIPGSGFGH